MKKDIQKRGMMKRVEIIKFIADYISENLRCPTIPEITKAVKLKSFSTTWFHLNRLGWTKNWRKRKQEITNEWLCPTCHQPLIKKVK